MHFTDTSTGDQIVEWQWKFDYTGSQVQAPPDPTFTAVGNQPVSLWIKNGTGAFTVSIPLYKDDSNPAVITASFKAHVVGSNTWSNEPSIQY